jgi:transcription initiation factor IIE alpha subunit
MFISSNEKQYFHDTLNDLNRKIQIQAEITQQQIATLKEENANLSKRLIQLLSNIPATVKDKLPQQKEEKPVTKKTSPTKREYAKQYYWRKKAERIADGSKEKIRGHKGVANVSENANNTSV